MSGKKERVAVMGASRKPERYSYKAVKLLAEHGHTPVPITLKDPDVLGHEAYHSITDVEGAVDTVTLYIGPKILKTVIDDIIAKQPKRVIMNPGTEDQELAEKFENAGIPVTQACTLVLLTTNQF